MCLYIYRERERHVTVYEGRSHVDSVQITLTPDIKTSRQKLKNLKKNHDEIIGCQSKPVVLNKAVRKVPQWPI